MPIKKLPSSVLSDRLFPSSMEQGIEHCEDQWARIWSRIGTVQSLYQSIEFQNSISILNVISLTSDLVGLEVVADAWGQH